jgi:hypothetical protein
MGRHVEASGTPFDLRRLTQIAGLVGGVVWVLAYFLPDDGAAAEVALLRVGAVVLTVALCGLGLLLVRSDFLALRIFVAVAVPLLVWGVFAIVHQSLSDPEVVDGVFGAIVAVVSAVRLGHQGGASRATL